MSSRAWRASGALLLLACSRLPEILAGECGNGVLEPPEDCDGFAADTGAACRPAGAVGECHFDCSGAAGASVCPSGWGCDLAGICRPPTGSLLAPVEHDVGTAALLASGDFDGDGRADVMSAELPDPYGVTRVKFHYFDERAALSETRPFRPLVLSPAVAEMTGDERRDVVFSDGLVGLLAGSSDRSWVPETFSSYRVTGSAIRTLMVRDELVGESSGFIVFTALNGIAGVYIPDAPDDGPPELLAPLPAPVEALAGHPVAGQLLVEAPCRQAVFALRGESELTLLDVCARADDGSVVWRSEPALQTVPLVPPAPIVAAPQIVDMNGDGYLDVIVGVAERAFVAFGDGQALGAAEPLVLAAPSEGEPAAPVPMPLAAGDLSGDGVVDLVYPDGVLISVPPAAPGGPSGYEALPAPALGSWTTAAIADLNANGLLDVIAGSSERPGLDFLNGTGSRHLPLATVPTSRPVQHLGVGDYDGDLVEDVAIIQRGASEADESAISIAFGVPYGPPSAPVTVARLDGVEQMTTYREQGLSHLLLASSEGAGGERRGVLALLAGSGDRTPTASYALTNFANDSSVASSEALRVVGGAFLGPGRGDALALAFHEEPMNDHLQLWLLPELASSPGTPEQLAEGVPSGTRPVRPERSGFSLAVAAADVEGDGRDEALIAAPGADDQRCALSVLQIEPDRVLERTRLELAEPCTHIELAPAHVDDDGRLDVLWLTGDAGSSARQLSIFWNDGAGGFSAERRTIASGPSGPGGSPRAFAVLEAGAAGGASVVHATAGELWRTPVMGPGALGEPGALLPLEGCTGLVAADVNGDGATDLVAAARGNLHVLAAELEAL